MTRTPESDMKAIHGARSQMQAYSDQLNPTQDGQPVTDGITVALLVSCYGTNRIHQPNSFQQFCNDVCGGPPNRRSTGTDMVAQLRIPPEANVRVSYREHRIRATLSTPGMMIGTGNLLILDDHAPNALVIDWMEKLGNHEDPLTIADIVAGLPAYVISTITRKNNHVIMEYVDDEIAWGKARRTIADKTEGRS